MSYKDTELWNRTLGSPADGVQELRVSYEKAYKFVGTILEKIRKDFPSLTVHDLNHVDSLWVVADTILGPDYKISPLEGYILGISFLIHDSVLSYEAFGGVDVLRNTLEWGDEYSEHPGNLNEEDFKKECDFNAIRRLHAKKAEHILEKDFSNDNSGLYITSGRKTKDDKFMSMLNFDIFISQQGYEF